MLLRINREGEFITTPAQNTQDQCGRQGAVRFRYFVSIEASNKKLTADGYVMENMWVADYFRIQYEEKRVPVGSCERVAQKAVAFFLNLFATHPTQKGVKPTRILVRIHGSDVSFIEAEWRAANAI